MQNKETSINLTSAEAQLIMFALREKADRVKRGVDGDRSIQATKYIETIEEIADRVEAKWEALNETE